MTHDNRKGVRLLSVLMALLFVLGAARPAWSCPSQTDQPSCCCEPKAESVEASKQHPDPRLARVCCCEAKPATEGTTSTPQVATTSSDRSHRDFVAPAAVRPSLGAPALVLIESAARSYSPNQGPPLQSLLRLRTLFIC